MYFILVNNWRMSKKTDWKEEPNLRWALCDAVPLSMMQEGTTKGERFELHYGKRQEGNLKICLNKNVSFWAVFLSETGSCYTAPCCLELSFLSLPAWSTVTYHHAQLWARFKVVLLLSSFTLPTFKFLWDTRLSGAQRQYTKYKRNHRANENSKVMEARTRLMRPCLLSFWFAHLFFHQGSYNYSKHGFRHRWDDNEWRTRKLMTERPIKWLFYTHLSLPHAFPPSYDFPGKLVYPPQTQLLALSALSSATF